MKKILIAVVAAFLSMAMLGCSQQQTTDEEPSYQDEQFVIDLGKALDARWALIDKYTAEGNIDRDAEEMRALIQEELNILEPYKTALFEDSKLHELAISYINALENTMDKAEYYSSNNLDSLEEWNDAYDQRTLVLKELLTNYDVKTNEKYESIKNELIVDGKNAQKGADVDAALQKLADGIVITFQQDPYGFVTGTTMLTNTTEYDFDYVGFDVQLYDEAGVRIETTYLTIDNWVKGETVNQEVYMSASSIPARYTVKAGDYILSK